MKTVTLTWLGELFIDSFKNLVRHKLRSFLTLLGMVFGVASVITMLAVGEGAQKSVLAEISELGLKNIIIDSVTPPDTNSDKPSSSSGITVFHFGLTQRDADQIKEIIPNARICQTLWVKEKIHNGSQRVNAEVFGVPPDYFNFFKTKLPYGRRLSAIDDIEAHHVAVVSRTVAESLQGPGRGPDKVIKVGSKHFQIVGVVDMPSLKDQGRVFIPYKTAKLVFGTTTIKMEAGRADFTRTDIGQIVVRAEREDQVESISEAIKHSLERNHKDADYAITVPLDILRSKQRTQSIFNLVLVAIAAISLVVGGIGIMNIMLAIVMERVREIGIRRAIGARPRDIFMQFLSESLTLTTIGGIAGCLVGLSMVPLASSWTGWPGIVTPDAIALALVVSWLVGLIFGTAPALRASRLNPVGSLRHE